jgi:hypothetical protein
MFNMLKILVKIIAINIKVGKILDVQKDVLQLDTGINASGAIISRTRCIFCS